MSCFNSNLFYFYFEIFEETKVTSTFYPYLAQQLKISERYTSTIGI